MKSNKTFSILIATAIMAWAVFSILFWQFSNVRASVAVLQQERDLESRRGATALTIQDILQETEDDVGRLRNHLATDDTVVDFIQLIESYADDAEVSLDVNSVGFETGKEEGAPRMLVVQMVSRGEWQQTFQFVSFMENMPFVEKFSRAGLKLETVSGEEGDSKQWRGDYTITVIATPEI